MKIVQSFWSGPYLAASSPKVDNRLHGGWPHRLYNYYSWALSCLRLRRYYDQVELVTDDFGHALLIDKLGLPYSSVSLALNELAGYDVGLWALGKVHAYGQQEEAFLHVDGDIFISGPFGPEISGASLTAQHFDHGYPGYFGVSEATWEMLGDIPPYFREVYAGRKANCCNAGILGGRNIDFIRAFVREVFSFLESNQEEAIRSCYQVDPIMINIILEQALFYYYARHRGEEITYLFPEIAGGPPGIGLFQLAEANKEYVHCYGFYKGLRASYSFLEWTLRSEFPVQYQRIRDLYEDAEI